MTNIYVVTTNVQNQSKKILCYLIQIDLNKGFL